MSLYNVKTTPENTYAITKFDDDLNPEVTYDVSLENCSCPAGIRKTCRHRQMLPLFINNQAIDSGKMYDYEAQTWRQFAFD